MNPDPFEGSWPRRRAAPVPDVKRARRRPSSTSCASRRGASTRRCSATAGSRRLRRSPRALPCRCRSAACPQTRCASRSRPARTSSPPYRALASRATTARLDSAARDAAPGDGRRPGTRPRGRLTRIHRQSRRDVSVRPDDCGSSKASTASAQYARSLLHQCRRRLPLVHRRRDVADRVVTDAGANPTARPRPALVLAYGAGHVPRTGRDEQSWTRSDAASQRDACPGKGILGRIRPSLPRRPYEDGHLLQLERCHDVQQHSGGLAAGGGGGHAPRRRVDWSCGSACRRWPGARSGAAC